ncbi:hypothetical protein [Nocardiopsis sp. MG754419]|uniref:hypothetical protein n=1 Tax=Nocardiopsis sp. MG754419 TaxID=2259865 RepID=UPI001BAA4F48|nr:hypothetical protein [Nocardiopsis sp. MG754419]MBR8744833.1 hypothetical protein [Nocardiopsis sp. MG754419]
MPDLSTVLSGSPADLQDCDGIIDPSVFPIPTADHVHLADLALDLRQAGAAMAQTGEDTIASWGGLAGCYTAPESEVLLGALDPIAGDGEDVESGAAQAADALADFAEELRLIKGDWHELKLRAETFRESVIDDPEWDKADHLLTNKSSNVEKSNELKAEAERLVRRYEKAQRDCANAINAGISGRTRFFSSFEAEAVGNLGPNAFVFDTVHAHTDIPSQWGADASADQFWYQDAWDATWDFGTGVVEGAGGMVGAYSSEGWLAQSWGDSLKEYHWDNLTAAASLVGMYDAETDSLGWAGKETIGEAWKELAHSIVPWTEWDDRPGYVIGTAVLNIGVTAVGVALTATGVGAAVGVPLLAWRGMSMLDGMGNTGRGGSGADVDLPPLPNLPESVGQGAPVVRLDAKDLEAMGLSPAQIAEIEADLRRVMDEQGSASGGDGGSGTPQDPTVRETRAFDDIAGHPENVALADRVRAENQRGMADGDQAAKAGTSRAPASDEGTWTANELFDGPDGARSPVPVGSGGRDGDSASASVTPAPPPVTANATDIGGGGRSPGNEVAGARDDRGADLADRNPTATNQDPGTSSPRDHDSSAPGQANGTWSGGQGSNADSTSGGGAQTGNGGQGGSGGPNTHHQQPVTAEWSKTRVVEERGPIGPGVNEGAKPTRPEHELKTETVKGEQAPKPKERFGDGKDLSPNTSYSVYDTEGKYRGKYVTDENGDIRKIHVDAHYSKDRHPEFMNPRPNAEYHVKTKNSLHVYETNSNGRNLTSEGQFTRDSSPRISKEERAVTDAAKDYYKAYNKILQEDFLNNPEKYSGLDRAPQFEATTWHGGHVVGIGEFGGIPERLNQVAMIDHVNTHSKNDWALGNSYRNFEMSMFDVLEGDFEAISKRSDDSFYRNQLDAWEYAYSQGPPPPVIRAKVSQIYDPSLPDFEIKGKNGMPVKILDAPPSAIYVEYSINGVVQQSIELANLPDMK